jgi:hypothetical protein
VAQAVNTSIAPLDRGVLVFGLRVSATGSIYGFPHLLPPGFAFAPLVIGHLGAGEHGASLSGVAWMKLQNGSNGHHCRFVIRKFGEVASKTPLADLIAEPGEHGSLLNRRHLR